MLFTRSFPASFSRLMQVIKVQNDTIDQQATENLLQITSYLSAADVICLTLTCETVYRVLSVNIKEVGISRFAGHPHLQGVYLGSTQPL